MRALDVSVEAAQMPDAQRETGELRRDLALRLGELSISRVSRTRPAKRPAAAPGGAAPAAAAAVGLQTVFPIFHFPRTTISMSVWEEADSWGRLLYIFGSSFSRQVGSSTDLGDFSFLVRAVGTMRAAAAAAGGGGGRGVGAGVPPPPPPPPPVQTLMPYTTGAAARGVPPFVFEVAFDVTGGMQVPLADVLHALGLNKNLIPEYTWALLEPLCAAHTSLFGVVTAIDSAFGVPRVGAV